ncbi:MAG: hypothetical protein OJI67_18520 [Prosthecobacter sp.]|nr:hypothetical protein [Prosthecobacter sp.]
MSNAAQEERATVGDFSLFLEDQNVTLHLRGAANCDHLTISLYSLAEGLAHDWWTLFGGRDREVSLIKHRSGYAVPDIRMSFDGNIFEFSAHQLTYVNPDVRFWLGPTELTNRINAENQLKSFICEVLERLDSLNVLRTSAALRWERVQNSISNPEEAAFCEAAGALGLDPYQISDKDAAAISNASEMFGGEALSEFLSGVGYADQDRLLDWIRSAEHRAPYKARVGELRSIASDLAQRVPAREFEQSWALGYRRAQGMRSALNLGVGDRFESFKTLAEMLGAQKTFELAAQIDGLRALRSDHADAIYIHLRNHGGASEARASHLFTFARAVGDAACFLDEGRAPINELRSAYRQAAGRAFAAEFLAPISEIDSMLDDGRDTVSIADEFTVSTTVIDRQIENRSRIEKAVSK